MAPKRSTFYDSIIPRLTELLEQKPRLTYREIAKKLSSDRSLHVDAGNGNNVRSIAIRYGLLKGARRVGQCRRCPHHCK